MTDINTEQLNWKPVTSETWISCDFPIGHKVIQKHLVIQNKEGDRFFWINENWEVAQSYHSYYYRPTRTVAVKVFSLNQKQEEKEKQERIAIANRLDNLQRFVGAVITAIDYDKITVKLNGQLYTVTTFKDPTGCGECWDESYYQPRLMIGDEQVPVSEDDFDITD